MKMPEPNANYLNVPFISLYGPACMEHIQAAEAKLGAPLPPDFKNYLLTVNCALVDEQNCFNIELPVEKKDKYLSMIAGITPPDRYGSEDIVWRALLMRSREHSEGPLPLDAVPFTIGETDWELALTHRLGRHGEVWIKAWELLDQEESYDEIIGDPESHFYKVANSFDEFICSLRVQDDSDF